MFSQELCKARIRSFLVTGMTLTTSLPIKSQTCSIILRSGDWDGHWMMDMFCCSNHATVRRVGWSIVMRKHDWMIFVAKYVFYGIKRVFWQCSDMIVRIHFFIENDQIANTVGANDPHIITETIRFLLTMRRYSGIYFSPAVLHTPLSRHNMQGWTSIHPRKVSRASCLVLPSWRFWYTLAVVGAGSREQCPFFVQQHGCRLPDHGAFSVQFVWNLYVKGVQQTPVWLGPVSEIGCTLQAFRDSAHHGLWSSLDDHYLAIFAI